MYGNNTKLPKVGGLAVAVPGELAGYYEMHRAYGKLKWADLFEPIIKMCNDGVKIGSALRKAMVIRRKDIKKLQGLKDILMDKNGVLKPENSVIRRPKLAATLKKIAAGGADAFYRGSLAKDIVDDLRDHGSIISLNDLKNYRVKRKTPLMVNFKNYRAFTLPPPCGGAVVQYILNILKGYNMSSQSISNDDSTILTYHRIIEAMKFAYAKRSELADEDFVDTREVIRNMTSSSYGQETRMKISDTMSFNTSYYGAKFLKDDHGTSHLSVVDPQGNAVSMTSTINLYFGSMVLGRKTGILFNDEMDDFSSPDFPNSFGVPPSKTNFIQPGKRPLSSMSPFIVLDKNNHVKLVVGASGGTRIITGILMVMVRSLMLGESLDTAIDSVRFHHQLLPDFVLSEKFLPQNIKEGLEKKGHSFVTREIMSVVQAILREDDNLIAISDARKNGQSDGF